MNWLIIVLFIVALGEFFWIIFLFGKIRQIKLQEIKKMEERRSGFISIISHQLRTPLSIVKGYLEALLTGDQGQLAAGQKEYINDAFEINKDTINLVNDYLEAAKLDAEKMKITPTTVDFVDLVSEQIRRLALLAKASNCEIIFNPPKNKIPSITADPIKLKQVIENIITNAIKYTAGHGRAVIDVQEQGDSLVFSCQDTGLGIPRDQLPELFTKFFRAKNIIKKDTKGSGLGLYLTKLIVEAHGGRIWLTSREGHGTAVFIKLPKQR